MVTSEGCHGAYVKRCTQTVLTDPARDKGLMWPMSYYTVTTTGWCSDPDLSMCVWVLDFVSKNIYYQSQPRRPFSWPRIWQPSWQSKGIGRVTAISVSVCVNPESSWSTARLKHQSMKCTTSQTQVCWVQYTAATPVSYCSTKFQFRIFVKLPPHPSPQKKALGKKKKPKSTISSEKSNYLISTLSHF